MERVGDRRCRDSRGDEKFSYSLANRRTSNDVIT